MELKACGSWLHYIPHGCDASQVTNTLIDQFSAAIACFVSFKLAISFSGLYKLFTCFLCFISFLLYIGIFLLCLIEKIKYFYVAGSARADT